MIKLSILLMKSSSLEKVTKRLNRSANADTPLTNSTETLKEVKRLWNAVQDTQKTLKILVKEKEKIKLIMTNSNL